MPSGARIRHVLVKVPLEVGAVNDRLTSTVASGAVAVTVMLLGAPICSPSKKARAYPVSQVQVLVFFSRQVFIKPLPEFTEVLSGIVTSVTKVAARLHPLFVCGAAVLPGSGVGVKAPQGVFRLRC